MMMAKIRKGLLKSLFQRVKDSYTVVGPKLENSTIILSEIDFHDIPAGFRDQQEPGIYRMRSDRSSDIFSFSIGPDSFKKFLCPSVHEVSTFKKTSKGITVRAVHEEEKTLAFIGMRACDIAALRLLDKVFMQGPVREPGYCQRRRDIFIMAVNCLSPHGNCFCDSMGTGPEVTEGFDISATECDDYFFLETGSQQGEKILNGLPLEEIDDSDRDKKRARILQSRTMIRKSMRTGDLPGIIYRNMEHPRWAEIAERDLECGNCTMVCPTCFCNSSHDQLPISAISGNLRELSGKRIRTWDSCFSRNFARVHGGNFRPSRRARYRQWMAHKLAYWIEQFGSSGCVGCGRCITWCPVGIDITHELEELRRVR